MEKKFTVGETIIVFTLLMGLLLNPNRPVTNGLQGMPSIIPMGAQPLKDTPIPDSLVGKSVYATIS